MAYAHTGFAYHPQQQIDSSLDSKAAPFIDDEQSAVLDPSVLDSDIMHSPNAAFRKSSFANSTGVLSPAESHGWDQQYVASLGVDADSAAISTSFQGEGNAYLRQANQPHSSFLHQSHPPPWPFEHGSGNGTPTTTAEFMPPPPPQYETAPYHRADSAHGSFSHQLPSGHFSMPHAESGYAPAPQVQTPLSPRSHQDWMGLAQQEMDRRPSHKRMRPDSPSRSLVELQRRDGIRKKNGRIDIPQERNIQTIDDLIERTTDDELLKELKQQKRLLRNREAALASRQRKKKHTEDLEVKEKNYTQRIAMLEADFNNLKVQKEHCERERQVFCQRLGDAQRVIEVMQDEKKDLIMKHNEEASSLRKKVQILTDQLESGPAPPMSAIASSTGFTDFNAEMEALNMGPHDWDNFIMASEMPSSDQDGFQFQPKSDPSKATPAAEKKTAAAAAAASAAAAAAAAAQQEPKQQNDSTSDQPIASGLLFMLLLCGAFVASKPANSQPPDLPKMPADVCAAAPTVLNDLLLEPALTSHDKRFQTVSLTQEELLPSSLMRSNLRPGRLDRMHRTMTAPTKQQEIDQAFSLTSAQYASLTGMDMSIYEQPSAPSQTELSAAPRRNLAEALSNLEQEHGRKTRAEVYTRSLLWDQIPADVVQQFKAIVRDHQEIEARQQQQQQQKRPRQSYETTYKVEQ